MIRSIKISHIFGVFLLLTACAKQLVEAPKDKLQRRKTQELLLVMDSLSHKKPGFFYTKIKTDYVDTNRSVSFKTSIRMAKDSAINALITYASLPIVNSIIKVDSVTIVNKRDKCFIQQSLGYFKENFGIDFDYANIEELILGMPLDYDTTQKYFQIHDPYTYTISSHKKREIKKKDRLDRDRNPAKDDIIINYFLNDNLDGLKGMYLESPDDSTSIKVDYLTREFTEGYSIPKDVHIEIKSPKNVINVDMQYDKVEIDQPQELFLVIPEGYEKCK
jgi:hypothetical protein